MLEFFPERNQEIERGMRRGSKEASRDVLVIQDVDLGYDQNHCPKVGELTLTLQNSVNPTALSYLFMRNSFCSLPHGGLGPRCVPAVWQNPSEVGSLLDGEA
jgi:hypothetical protein